MTGSPSSTERFRASEEKATREPSAEMDGEKESASPAAPPAPEARLTRTIAFTARSRTYTSSEVSSSSADRSPASEEKATNRPSPDREGSKESPSPPAPKAPAARLARVVVPVARSRTNTLRKKSSSSSERVEAREENAT